MMMMIKNKNNGFALLYSLLIAGTVLAVGIILMNIITKQLVFSSINRSSEKSYYYAANSGQECLEYYAMERPETFYSSTELPEGGREVIFENSASIDKCFSTNISFIRDDNVNFPKYTSESFTSEGTTIILSVQFNKACIIDPVGGCSGLSLIEKSRSVRIVEGYSGNASRVAKGVSVIVEKSFD